jgi:predicted metalloprotease
MRLGGERESSNIEDRRGSGGGFPIGIAGGGFGTIALVVVALVFCVDNNLII